MSTRSRRDISPASRRRSRTRDGDHGRSQFATVTYSTPDGQRETRARITFDDPSAIAAGIERIHIHGSDRERRSSSRRSSAARSSRRRRRHRSPSRSPEGRRRAHASAFDPTFSFDPSNLERRRGSTPPGSVYTMIPIEREPAGPSFHDRPPGATRDYYYPRARSPHYAPHPRPERSQSSTPCMPRPYSPGTELPEPRRAASYVSSNTPPSNGNPFLRWILSGDARGHTCVDAILFRPGSFDDPLTSRSPPASVVLPIKPGPATRWDFALSSMVLRNVKYTPGAKFSVMSWPVLLSQGFTKQETQDGRIEIGHVSAPSVVLFSTNYDRVDNVHSVVLSDEVTPGTWANMIRRGECGWSEHARYDLKIHNIDPEVADRLETMWEYSGVDRAIQGVALLEDDALTYFHDRNELGWDDVAR